MYRILIVEDDRTNRLFYEKLPVWQQEGFVIGGQAENGKRALEQMETEQFDAFFVDVMMPVMNGLEFLQELKNRGITAPRIIVSNYNEFSYVRHESDDFVNKHMGIQIALTNPEDERIVELTRKIGIRNVRMMLYYNNFRRISSKQVFPSLLSLHGSFPYAYISLSTVR